VIDGLPGRSTQTKVRGSSDIAVAARADGSCRAGADRSILLFGWPRVGDHRFVHKPRKAAFEGGMRSFKRRKHLL
jgi:hypothetical protein